MSSIKKNYLYSVLYQILSIIVPLITTPYLARVLGTEKSGIYSYTSANVQYFILISMLGILDYGNRTIATLHSKEDRGRVFKEIYTIQFTTSVIALFIYAFYLLLGISSYWGIAAMQGIAILASLFDISWFFFGVEKFGVTVTRNIIIRIASLFLIFIFVRDSDDLWKYVLISAGSILVSNIILWFFLKREVVLSKIDINQVLIHLKPCLILMLPLISRSVFVYLDKTMLGLLSGMDETGYYEYSERVILAATSVITPLGTVMLPRISSLLSQGEERIAQRYTALSMDFVVGIGMALTMGSIAVADTLVSVFLGDEYVSCGSIVKMMSITIILVGWTNVIRTQYILPYKKDKVYMLAVFAGAVIDFMFNCLLIPKLGALGAAIGWVAAEIAITLSQTIYASRKLPILDYIRKEAGFVVVSIIMYIIVSMLSNSIERSLLSLVACVLVGAFIYLGLSTVYIFVFRKDLWIMFVEYIQGKNNRLRNLSNK